MTPQQIIQKFIPDTYQAQAQESGNCIVFPVPPQEIAALCKYFYHEYHLPLQTVTCLDERKDTDSFVILYVFAVPGSSYALAPALSVSPQTGEFPSLTPVINEVSYYEREIQSMFGLKPVGHPNPQQLLLHDNWPDGLYPLRKDFEWNTRPEMVSGQRYQFATVAGEGVYELPVGPIHAGIIEPGHFRFSLAGEEVLLLDPRLGYKHKGVEKLFEVVPFEKKVAVAERVSGDSSFAHSLAFCQALEMLTGCEVPERAKFLRVVFAEMERLANHFNDIGFIMLDTAYNFGGSQCARLRELVMQWNERLAGSRHLRGVNTPGGVKKDISGELLKELENFLQALERDFSEVLAVAERSLSLLNRLKDTGNLDLQVAKDHGVRGVPMRALGVMSDTRATFPYAAYGALDFEVSTHEGGDVYARFMVRVKEVFHSLRIIRQALEKMPEGEVVTQLPALAPSSYAHSAVEGWRGEIAYFVATDAAGEIGRVHARDCSYLNWTAVPYAVAGNVVPDFPLINKSFNLSYSGYDR